METLGLTFEDVVKHHKLTHYSVTSKEGKDRDEWHIIQLGNFNGREVLNIVGQKSIDSWEEFLEFGNSSLRLVYIYQNDRKSFDWFKDFFESKISLVGVQLFKLEKMVGKTIKSYDYQSGFSYPKISICFTDKTFITLQTGEDCEEREPTLSVSQEKMNLSKSNCTLDDVKEWCKIGLISKGDYDAFTIEYENQQNLINEEFQKANAVQIEADERKLLAELKAKYEPVNK